AATGQGSNGPADYATYCWIDFTNYDDTTARSAGGQAFTISLPNGGSLSFTLNVTTSSLTTVTVPSWSGAAFGQTAFLGVPGRTVLYQTTNGTTTNVTLSGISITVGTGSVPYAIVAADAESTNNGESLSFTTNGNAWTLLATMPNGASLLYPTLTGVGTATVNETGVAGTVGAYAFATEGSPTIISSVLGGGGLQGIAFGLKFHAADLAVTSSHSGSFNAGGTGNYTLTVHNNGPDAYVPANTITVTDTLPTGLTYASVSGSGWSCSVVGQVVTCTTGANLASGASLPAITLNVNAAYTAPASVNNSVSVAVLNGYDYDSSNDTYIDATTIVHPDLSTSTKSVLDINGGDANPGDILQYTITLSESAGVAAVNASAIDNMPAGITAFAVVSTPAGSTNSSTGGGGTNGTGYLNVTAISVPANGSVTIVYDVTVAAGDTPGYTIDNTATITNPYGSGATPAAGTVTVSQSLIAASGNKILYLYDDTGPYTQLLNRVPQANNTGTAITIHGNNANATWNMTPAVATGKILALPAQTVSVRLVMAATNNQTTTSRAIRVTLYNGATAIGNATQNVVNGNTAYTYSIAISAQTIAAGNGLNLQIQNTNGTTAHYITVSQKTAGQGASAITFASTTVINVDSVSVYSAAYPATTTQPAYAPGSVIYIRTVVSDPFGSYDVDPATGGTAPTLTLKDVSGTTELTPTSMSQVADSGVATRTFEYAYTIPGTPVFGYWTPSVTAYEGTEGAVTHTANGSFNVQPVPNLSTSTKTVVDTNGGDANPGDILEYTITLNESGGVTATNVSVTDNIPAGVTTFTIINTPSGSTNSSNPTGGTNGTGYLNITGISVPANGSVSIVFNVTVGSDAAGYTIDNTATVTNPNGPGATPAAPTVTVSQSMVAASGNKILYVYDDQTLTRTPQTGAATQVTVGEASSADWVLTPALQKALVLTPGTNNVSISLTMRRSGSGGGNTARSVYVQLFKKNGATYTQIGANSGTQNFTSTTWTSYPFTITVPAGTAGNLAAGNQLVLRVQNSSAGGGTRTIDVEQDTGGNASIITFATSTVINVDSVSVYSAVYPATTTPTGNIYEPNNIVYIRAVVSDPFGSYDIDPTTGGTAPTLTLTDANGTVQLTAVNMKQVADSGAATKTFEYYVTGTTGYTLTNTAAIGFWTPTVTATEGTEGTVTHTANGSFDVETPVLLVMKAVSAVTDPVHGTTRPKSIPGATMQYLVNLSNNGKGAGDNNSLVITDPVPSNSGFMVGSVIFTNGATSSGLTLSAANVNYSNNGGATWTYTPVAGGDGTDPNVTNIRFSPQGSMAGKTGGTAPSFSITFKVIIK
ncbi:MAG: beta strand repeat-containing protein, partial [Gammaproteobacteria bacterium]